MHYNVYSIYIALNQIHKLNWLTTVNLLNTNNNPGMLVVKTTPLHHV